MEYSNMRRSSNCKDEPQMRETKHVQLCLLLRDSQPFLCQQMSLNNFLNDIVRFVCVWHTSHANSCPSALKHFLDVNSIVQIYTQSWSHWSLDSVLEGHLKASLTWDCYFFLTRFSCFDSNLLPSVHILSHVWIKINLKLTHFYWGPSSVLSSFYAINEFKLVQWEISAAGLFKSLFKKYMTRLAIHAQGLWNVSRAGGDNGWDVCKKACFSGNPFFSSQAMQYQFSAPSETFSNVRSWARATKNRIV